MPMSDAHVRSCPCRKEVASLNALAVAARKCARLRHEPAVAAAGPGPGRGGPAPRACAARQSLRREARRNFTWLRLANVVDEI